MKRSTAAIFLSSLLAVSACSSSTAPKEAPAAAAEAPKKKLGIRPNGDTEISPDMTLVKSEDLKKVFAYIDEHIDDHVENLQKWICLLYTSPSPRD